MIKAKTIYSNKFKDKFPKGLLGGLLAPSFNATVQSYRDYLNRPVFVVEMRDSEGTKTQKTGNISVALKEIFWWECAMRDDPRLKEVSVASYKTHVLDVFKDNEGLLKNFERILSKGFTQEGFLAGKIKHFAQAGFDQKSGTYWVSSSERYISGEHYSNSYYHQNIGKNLTLEEMKNLLQEWEQEKENSSEYEEILLGEPGVHYSNFIEPEDLDYKCTVDEIRGRPLRGAEFVF